MKVQITTVEVGQCECWLHTNAGLARAVSREVARAFIEKRGVKNVVGSVTHRHRKYFEINPKR